MASLKTYLRLMRPANIITSVADIIAGIAISGYFIQMNFVAIIPVVLLSFSTACLYAGGIVYNDIFDFEIDKIERPERVLPSEQISITQAVILGSLLLITGVALATIYSYISGIIALAIAGAALIYDKLGKHNRWFGPLNMGICRGLNLLLGISIIPAALAQWYFIALVPIVYIYSITMISQGEVSGGGRRSLYAAMVLYFIVILTIATLSYGRPQFLITILLLIAFGFVIIRPLLRAVNNPIGSNIGRAVKAGVIALIIMDAAWAMAFNAIYIALFICLLLPISFWLSRIFAVT